MTRTSVTVAAALALVLAQPWSAGAANKEHQQLMAEIRMLQEQQQQINQMLGNLGDALKTLTTRLDEQGNITRKTFADQKLLIDGVGDTVRVLREKADDTNVRLSTMNQELEAMRQAIMSMPQPSAVPPATGDPGATANPGGPSPGPTPPPPGPAPIIAPQKLYDNAFADYTAGQYDLAVIGFETFIKTSPRSELADDAQLNIGNALYAAGKFKEAVPALMQVINGYPQSNSVAAAWYKLGLTYEQLKQADQARKAYETVIKNHEGTIEASLARQGLERLKREEI
jgi:tol-pal system protein YbgF